MKYIITITILFEILISGFAYSYRLQARLETRLVQASKERQALIIQRRILTDKFVYLIKVLRRQ